MIYLTTDKYLHQYIYGKRHQVKGSWVATPTLKDPNVVHIGWSLCNKKDKYDKLRGFNIAFGRAYKGSTDSVPYSLKVGFYFFKKRCHRYFKDKKINIGYHEE